MRRNKTILLCEKKNYDSNLEVILGTIPINPKKELTIPQEIFDSMKRSLNRRQDDV